MDNRKYTHEIRAYLKESILTIWIPNALANGTVYYFMNRHIEKSALDFWIGGTITAFILAIICGACAIPTIEKKLREGKLHAESYTRQNHIIGRFMPKKTGRQLLFIALLVTIVFTFVSGALPLIFGFLSTDIPIKTGTLLHSIQCGFMGLLTVYLTMIGRCIMNQA